MEKQLSAYRFSQAPYTGLINLEAIEHSDSNGQTIVWPHARRRDISVGRARNPWSGDVRFDSGLGCPTARTLLAASVSE